MDYPLENLGDERFQEFCQSLLISEFPKLQCFPIGQRDGGRDAILWTNFSQRKRRDSFIVFQVKFVRNPCIEAPHKWLTKTIEGEIGNINKLIPRGAKEYYLVTNVRGTAPPDTGSKDLVDTLFSTTLSIPGFCWWRDDVCRRLDRTWNLKWAYPEILTGPDILRLVIEQGLSEEKERRNTALRFFLQKQYEDDRQVRFKQIELECNLTDLFVDTPIELCRDGEETKEFSALFRYLSNSGTEDAPLERGAARLLFDHTFSQVNPFLVIEGAPGQGKSTLSQYVCQVHRMRLLNETQAFKALPKQHQPIFAKFPLRIELRDLAVWFDKQDPYSSDPDTSPPKNWSKTVDSFLAHQISTFSGGSGFTVSDLHATLKLFSILLVLDGFDEVADVKMRKEIIDAVCDTISRLRNDAASLQVLITSRPAIFSKSSGFAKDKFPHVQLAPLPKPLIEDFAEKWLRARRLAPKDCASIRKTLKQKLEQTHLRQLARNPMQLSILMRLMEIRGTFLPEKRTALYDEYVNVFFNREAEKDSRVRENRELLISIHQYLGWTIHSTAEKDGRGSITHDHLKKLLNAYLEIEGHTSIEVSSLFAGVVDRIMFLVSRVIGTYEFEVQPLREYFCARYLYETAPYAPHAKTVCGTKPDRFDACVSNPYWLQVTRFYAGCYNKGELACLVDCLISLGSTEGFKFTNYAQRVTGMLLADWVFSQDPRSIKRAVEFLASAFGGAGLTNTKRSRWRPFPNEDVLILPQGSGREELVAKCFENLKRSICYQQAFDLPEIIKANATPKEIENFWTEELGKRKGESLSSWFRIGLSIGALAQCTTSKLKSAVQAVNISPNDWPILFSAGHGDMLKAYSGDENKIVESILNCECAYRYEKVDLISILSLSFDPIIYRHAFDHPSPVPLIDSISNYSNSLSKIRERIDKGLDCPLAPGSPLYLKVFSVVEAAKIEWKKNTSSTLR